MPMPIITSIISAGSIVIGSLLGAYFSWLINKKMHLVSNEEKEFIRQEDRKYEENKREKENAISASLVRLDIATALFQSIRGLKNNDLDKIYLYSLPINPTYATALASLTDKYTLKELSYLYQLYGIIEKVNRDIHNFNKVSEVEYERIKLGFMTILEKIYGNNAPHIIKLNEDKVSYNELYSSEFTKEEYKDILKRLDQICNLKTID